MFQCIIQQRNGWIHAPNPETRDVFPGNWSVFSVQCLLNGITLFKMMMNNIRLLTTALFIKLLLHAICVSQNWEYFKEMSMKRVLRVINDQVNASGIQLAMSINFHHIPLDVRLSPIVDLVFVYIHFSQMNSSI